MVEVEKYPTLTINICIQHDSLGTSCLENRVTQMCLWYTDTICSMQHPQATSKTCI